MVVHQLPYKAYNILWVVGILGEENITYKLSLEDIKYHKPKKGKTKVKIFLCKIKCYQHTNLEELRYWFYQIIPVL